MVKEKVKVKCPKCKKEIEIQIEKRKPGHYYVAKNGFLMLARPSMSKKR